LINHTLSRLFHGWLVLITWLQKSGDTLINEGFNNFKDLYNNETSNSIKVGYQSTKNEQTVLQSIHEQ